MINFVRTQCLNVGYLSAGDPGGWPVVLLHGFPYDVHAYDGVTEQLVQTGAHVYAPYLRGYGPTRFLRQDTPRSGQQAALGNDLREFVEALGIERPIVAGYDWGGRAACIVAALYPHLVHGLVSCNSYNIQDIEGSIKPLAAEQEHRLWYQYYFHSERGRRGLAENRKALCRLLWQLWSPTWHFTDAIYEQSASAFDNPDFVDVVIHSYRHRFGLVEGDPSLVAIEQKLALQPPITVASVTLDGSDDGVSGGSTQNHARHFTGEHHHVTVPGVGHNLPQEAPDAFTNAILQLHAHETPNALNCSQVK